jgi:hypothetical protein
MLVAGILLLGTDTVLSNRRQELTERLVSAYPEDHGATS